MKDRRARLDVATSKTYRTILPRCRLGEGEVWADPVRGHRIGVLDASARDDVARLLGDIRVPLFIHDPPYNVSFGQRSQATGKGTHALDDYLRFTRAYVKNSVAFMADNASLYLWLGADQKNGFQPLPEVMILLREFRDLASRSFITMRNQRGYGTQKNWMSVRQELLYYTKGTPCFTVAYTDIPKKVKGYYKNIGGVATENIERSRSATIRAGNVWTDIQQVFYRMRENVSGCFAQKPLKAIERIVLSSSNKGDAVCDLFAHSGTTLIACEKHSRTCYTSDINPIFAEIAIRRLEHFRATGREGFQGDDPFSDAYAPQQP